MSELSAYVSKACAGCCPASSAHCRKRTRPGIMRRRPSIRRGRHGIKQPGPGIKRRAVEGAALAHFFFEGLF